MRPFSLEEALAGQPVITREGKKVIEIKLFETAPDDSFFKLAVHIEGKYQLYSYKKNGKFGNHDYESENDLFMGYTLEEIQLDADRYQALKNELREDYGKFIATMANGDCKNIYFRSGLDKYADELIRTANEPKK